MSALSTLTRLFAPFVTRRPVSRAVTDDVARLANLLDVSPELLLAFRAGLPRGYNYRPLQIRKRDGAPRAIYAPSPALKTLQRALLRSYLEGLDAHPAALGFRKGRSIIDHARAHQGQALVLTADIEDFFTHITAGRVDDFYIAQGWDEAAAAILTQLCTLRGAAPQGAPTSPALSNLVNVPLDEALAALAGRTGGRYTRYGDDLAFSWPVETLTPETQRALRATVLTHGYRLNMEKWRVYYPQRGEEPRLTGVILGRDGALRPLPEVVKSMQRLTKAAQASPPDAQTTLRLHGYRGFINMLNPKQRRQSKYPKRK
jgi:RNA-directed DNA polymerase